MLRSLRLWIVSANLNPILYLSTLNALQLLSLYDVFEPALVPIALQFVEQMDLVLLELFDPRV